MRAPASGRRGLRRDGFTLIEVLVAMVIAGLLGGVIFQLMHGQASFVDVQSGRQEVQQNARGTLELISSELRGVPPGAITVADVNRIQFYTPRAWGITCNDMGGGGTVWILVPEAGVPSDLPSSPSDDWRLLVPVLGGNGTWKPLPISSISTGTPSCPDYDLTELENYSAVAVSYTDAGSTTRQQGESVFLGQRVTYEVGTGSSSARLWVKRNNGAGATQVMAGPLTAADGLSFDYWCDNGKATPPVTTGIPFINAVQVRVSMESTRGSAAGAQVETDSTRIALRNETVGGSC